MIIDFYNEFWDNLIGAIRTYINLEDGGVGLWDDDEQGDYMNIPDINWFVFVNGGLTYHAIGLGFLEDDPKIIGVNKATEHKIEVLVKTFPLKKICQLADFINISIDDVIAQGQEHEEIGVNPAQVIQPPKPDYMIWGISEPIGFDGAGGNGGGNIASGNGGSGISISKGVTGISGTAGYTSPNYQQYFTTKDEQYQWLNDPIKSKF